jgi:peptidoglycan/LPS O-acetylase OafA/YrhL
MDDTVFSRHSGVSMFGSKLAPHGRRILEIDALRGLAATAVLLHHDIAAYDFYHGRARPIDVITDFGSFGVHLFFVISGFVILMSLERCPTVLNFVVSRFSRIFPAYWAAILVTTAFLYLLHAPDLPGPLQIAANFTMLDRLLGFFHIDAVYWTLNIEMSFYLWMILLFKFGGLRRVEWVIPFVLGFQMAVWLYCRATGHIFSQGVKVVFLLEYAHLFCAGMLFFRLWQDGFQWPRILLLAWCLLNQPLVHFRDFAVLPGSFWGVLAVAGIFAIMFLVVNGKMSWLVQPALLFLGSISYTLYLVHHQIGIEIMDRLQIQGYSHGFGCLVAIIFAFLLAFLLSYLIEKPAMSFIRQRYKSHKRSA